MIGDLTIEKANYNISYMAASLLVLHRVGGRMSRGQFVSQMAQLMGCSATTPDGKENRVPYNKTKFDRYFGFMDVDPLTKDLILTPRGIRAIQYISEDPDATDADKRYDFKSGCKIFLRELFFDSILFDAFGSFNCGAEESNSDIEPPKVILRLLKDVGPCSKEEIAYVLWGLDGGVFSDWEDAKSRMLSNRDDPSCDYEVLFTNWNRQNFVNDFKLLDLLNYDKWQLIEEDPASGWYTLASDLDLLYLAKISGLSPFVQPLHMILEKSTYGRDQILAWVRNSVLGRVGRNELIVTCDLSKDADSVVEDKLAEAIAMALKLRRYGVFADNEVKKSHRNAVVTFCLMNVSSRQNLEMAMSSVICAMPRKDSFIDKDHGWSAKHAFAPSLYQKVSTLVPSVSAFGMNAISLPSNLNFIGVA